MDEDFLSDITMVIALLVGAVFTMFALVVALLLPESPEFALLGGKLIIFVLLIAFALLFGSLGVHIRLRAELIGEAPQEILNIWDRLANYTFDLGVISMVTSLALIAYIFVGISAATILIIVLWIVDLMFIWGNRVSNKSLPSESSKPNFIWRHISIFAKAVVLIFLYLDFFGIFIWRTIPIPF